MPPLVSIIVPVYNTPSSYVRECFSSVIAQTYREVIELAVFDDGSTPLFKRQVKRALREIESELPVLFGETRENRGLCYARNDGAKMATGEYVLFLDSDDVLDPTIVEKCAERFAQDIVLVYTNHVMVSEDRKLIIHERDKRAYQRLLTQFKGTVFDPLLHCTFIFHAQVIRRHEFLKLGGLRTDLGYGDEVDMHLRLSELSPAVNFALVPETLYCYRDNPYSIVHQPDLYARLIANIERIIVESAERRGFDVQRAKRIGRALPTHAAHYVLLDSGGIRVEAPYFDYETCRLKPEYLSDLASRFWTVQQTHGY